MRRLAVTSALLFTLLGAATPAVAEAPIDVTGPVTDDVGALSDADRVRVDSALDAFYDRTHRQLFVVYVSSFDGLSGAEWAERTATESGLGQADVLLAVALQERSFGYSADAEDFSEEQLDTIDREHVLPALRQDDWAGAAVGAAEGLADASEGSGVPWVWVALGAVVLAGAALLVVRRVRRRYDHTHPVVDEHGRPVDPASILTDEELEESAAAALVAIDDALQTSTQELGYAEAQFGAEATTAFRTVLEDGRGRVREAFTLRQRLDDAVPETDAERRAMLSRILRLCEETDAALDAQVDHFDAVRDLQGRAPEALAALRTRLAEVTGHLPQARATWQDLSAEHAAPVLAAVRDNVAQAERLLAAAEDQATASSAAIEAGDTAAAAVHLRAAEDATGQGASLLDALETTRAELQTTREAADDLLGRVTSAVSAVTTYVETHRGAVGSTARTRLSEAARLLDDGQGRLGTDPTGATTALERADRLVQEAQSSAEADVAAWRAGQRRGSGTGSSLDGLVLGGILLDGLGRNRPSGARNASTPVRPAAPRPRGPGSYGGSRTRARRSGGGRF